jgi:hypothetical protein
MIISSAATVVTHVVDRQDSVHGIVAIREVDWDAAAACTFVVFEMARRFCT